MTSLYVTAYDPDRRAKTIRAIRQCRMALDAGGYRVEQIISDMDDLETEGDYIYVGTHDDSDVIRQVTEELENVGCRLTTQDEAEEVEVEEAGADGPDLDPLALAAAEVLADHDLDGSGTVSVDAPALAKLRDALAEPRPEPNAAPQPSDAALIATAAQVQAVFLTAANGNPNIAAHHLQLMARITKDPVYTRAINILVLAFNGSGGITS